MSVSRIQDGNAQMIQQTHLCNEQVRAESEQQANSGQVSSPSDRVDLSTTATAKNIQQLKDALSKLPDVREEKIREVQKMLKDGTYKVSADQIAGKMVGESILDLFI